MFEAGGINSPSLLQGGPRLEPNYDFCAACGEGIFTSEESEDSLAAVGAFRARVDAEPLVPTEGRRIRKKLGLKAL